VKEVDALLLTERNTFMKGYVRDEGKFLAIGIIYGEGRKVPEKRSIIAIKDVFILYKV
jgi:hypothetical protein